MDSQPSKSDLEAVFHRLRTTPANKVCFDCNAKNPTWASVTYGVFICIDCSAVHRSLGVHLTFVRSTQLDTNWTWVQLRQMQLGGNSNATQFFTQHNCITTDAQKKYNSRAAQLYKDKLHQIAVSSLRTNTQLHVHPHVEENSGEKEVDFFSEQENFAIPDAPQQHQQKLIEETQLLQKDNRDPEEGPTVDLGSSLTNAEPRKSTITTRKPPNKKSGLGAKKSGLGATKVKTNFAQLEREAEIAEESRLRALEETAKAAALSLKEQEEREAAVRLAYKDLSNEQLKKEEQMRKQDPKKAEQVERLGMGVNAKSGVSHSALSDMKEIEQENVQTTPSTLSSLGKLRISDTDSFFDEFSFSSGFNMNRTSKLDSFLAEASSRDRDRDNWVIVEDPVEKPKTTYRTPEKSLRSIDTSSDAAQKKFGNAKAISSEQFFNDREPDYETKANLNRFQGSSSISSAEFFGNGKETPQNSQALQAYDLEDVRESVRQGVTKVAGKISSLANGVMSSLQDRYGY